MLIVTDDAHVLATAIHSKCEFIITFNLKDFPNSILENYGVYCQHPDEFLSNMLVIKREAFLTAVTNQRRFLRKPPKSQSVFLSELHACGLVRLAEGLSKETI